MAVLPWSGAPFTGPDTTHPCWDGCGRCAPIERVTSADPEAHVGAPDTTVQPREGDALPPEEDACACGCKVCSEAKERP